MLDVVKNTRIIPMKLLLANNERSNDYVPSALHTFHLFLIFKKYYS